MKILLSCACGRTYKVSPGAAERAARCAACGAALVIPGNRPVAKAAAGRWPLRRILFWAGAPLGAFLLLAIGLYGVFVLRARGRLEDEVERIRSSGEHLAIEEIIPPRIPASRNAAVVYEQAFAALSELEANEDGDLGLWVAPRPSWTPEGSEALARAVLERNRQALELAHRAAGMPECRFDLEWERGLEMELPQLSKLKDLARLLQLEAIHRSRRGELVPALESAAAIFAIARAMDGEPVLITFLVRSSIVGIGLDTLWIIAGERPLPSEAARAWIAHLARFQDPAPFVRALQGERCLEVDGFDKVYRSPEGLGSGPRGALARLLRLHDLDLAAYLGLFAELLELARSPLYEVSDRARELQRRADELPDYCTVSKIILPALEMMLRSAAQIQTRLELARTALAVAGHRGERGGWPAGLGGLGVEAIDYATGRPLAYRISDGEAVLSVPDEGADVWNEIEPWVLRDSRALGWRAGAVRCLAWSADGLRLAAGGEGSGVSVVDAGSGRLLRMLDGRKGHLRALASSPDGGRLASADDEGTIRLWDLDSGAVVWEAEAPRTPAWFVSFHPGGEWLASAGVRFDARRASDGEALEVIDWRLADRVAFSGDGALMAVAGDDLALFRLPGGEEAWTLPGVVAGEMAFAPDGAHLATAGGPVVAVRETTGGGEIRRLEGTGDDVDALAFSPDGRWLASGDRHGRVRIWDWREGRLEASLPVDEHPGQVWALAFDPDGKELAVARGRPWVEVWDVGGILGGR